MTNLSDQIPRVIVDKSGRMHLKPEPDESGIYPDTPPVYIGTMYPEGRDIEKVSLFQGFKSGMYSPVSRREHVILWAVANHAAEVRRSYRGEVVI